MRFAHRFFVLWGMIAVLCFAVSALMTWFVVRTYARAQPNFVGMYGSTRLEHSTGEIEYYALSHPVWIATYPLGTHSVVLPGAAGTLCADARGTLVNGALGVLENVQRNSQRWLNRRLIQRWRTSDAFDVNEINVAHLQSPHVGGRIACFIDVRPHHESLTHSSFGIDFLRLIGFTPVGSLRVSATIPDAEGMQVYGGSSTSAGGTDLAAGTVAYFTYANVESEGTRDILFILIGSFIALGAATTLEAIRPYVELLAGRR